uniref:Uncharacterized protein n=1 Tax=Oryctolagus cuniculus TaxID=9986 RepID=A0A5F9CFT2_RABIT
MLNNSKMKTHPSFFLHTHVQDENCQSLFCDRVNMLTRNVLLQMMLTFEDLAIYFTWEEWQNMNKAQKILYRDVMLETYNSLLFLGHCITKPDLIFKLEQGGEPWMVNKCLNQSLPVAMKSDDIIRMNQEIQEKDFKQDVMTNSKTSTPKRVELIKRLNLSSSHVSKLIIKKGSYSAMKPEECNVCHNVHPHGGPDELQAGEKLDAAKVPGNSVQCCEHLSEDHKIQTVKPSFEHSGQGKDFKRKKIFFRFCTVHMGDPCNKSTITVGKTTQIEETLHKNTNLSKHQQINTGEKLYEDMGYVEPLIYKSDLPIDQRQHTEKKPYACQPCRISHVCNECGETTYQKLDLIRHQKIHTKKKPHECNEFQKTIFQKSYLITQQRIHTEDKPHDCKDCRKAFGKKSQLVVHQRIHTGEKPYECNGCGKAFLCKSQLIKHKGIHKGEKPHECNDCGKACGLKTDLIKHWKIHTTEKPHECNDCGKVFGSKSQLITHQRVHTGEKPYECKECGKAFGKKSTITSHQRIHTGEKPYECNDCGKAYGYKSDLIKHQRIHTGEKPYECNDCGKAYGYKSDLIKHQRIHTGEKPYECNDCGKAYGYKSDLIKHQRIHTGEKPHECKECGKAFGYKADLLKHQRIHTGEKPYECNDCGKASPV